MRVDDRMILRAVDFANAVDDGRPPHERIASIVPRWPGEIIEGLVSRGLIRLDAEGEGAYRASLTDSGVAALSES